MSPGPAGCCADSLWITHCQGGRVPRGRAARSVWAAPRRVKGAAHRCRDVVADRAAGQGAGLFRTPFAGRARGPRRRSEPVGTAPAGTMGGTSHRRTPTRSSSHSPARDHSYVDAGSADASARTSSSTADARSLAEGRPARSVKGSLRRDLAGIPGGEQHLAVVDGHRRQLPHPDPEAPGRPPLRRRSRESADPGSPIGPNPSRPPRGSARPQDRTSGRRRVMLEQESVHRPSSGVVHGSLPSGPAGPSSGVPAPSFAAGRRVGRVLRSERVPVRTRRPAAARTSIPASGATSGPEHGAAGPSMTVVDRAREGTLDGHGHLLCDDMVCLPDGPRVLDCLEFGDHLRHVDGLDDVVFPAVDSIVPDRRKPFGLR